MARLTSSVKELAEALEAVSSLLRSSGSPSENVRASGELLAPVPHCNAIDFRFNSVPC